MDDKHRLGKQKEKNRQNFPINILWLHVLQQYITLQNLRNLRIYSSSSAYDQRFYRISCKLLNNNNSFKTLKLRNHEMLSHFVKSFNFSIEVSKLFDLLLTFTRVRSLLDLHWLLKRTNLIIGKLQIHGQYNNINRKKETTVKTIINRKVYNYLLYKFNQYSIHVQVLNGHQRFRNDKLLELKQNANWTELVRIQGVCKTVSISY